MQQYATEAKYLKYQPERITGILSEHRIYKRCSKCGLLQLMQSCNCWINDCLDRSFTCGFMAAHSSIIQCGLFSSVFGTPGTQRPSRVLNKKKFQCHQVWRMSMPSSWSTTTNIMIKIYVLC